MEIYVEEDIDNITFTTKRKRLKRKQPWKKESLFRLPVDLHPVVIPLPESILLKDHPNNYFKDGSFETKEEGIIYEKGLIVCEEARSGLKCLLIREDTEIPIPSVYEKGIYTLSFYLKSDIPIQLGVYDEKELVSEMILKINPSSHYQRYILNVFLNPYPTIHFFKIQPLEKGSIYLDDIQLEKGEVVNYYNWIENSNFTKGTSPWIILAENYRLVKAISPNFLGKEVNALEIAPELNETVKMYQEITLNGKTDDFFSVSFQYLLEDFSRYQVHIEFIMNQKVIEKNIFYLSSNYPDWQIFYTEFKAKEDYEKIRFKIEGKEQSDTIFVTNFSLIKEKKGKEKIVQFTNFLEASALKKYFLVNEKKGNCEIEYDLKKRIEKLIVFKEEYFFQYNKENYLEKVLKKNKKDYLNIEYDCITQNLETFIFPKKSIFFNYDEMNHIESIESKEEKLNFLYNNDNQLAKMYTTKKTYILSYEKEKVIIKNLENDETIQLLNWNQFLRKLIDNVIKK